MLSRFLLTLLSSWIVNPLGIFVAQGFGVANEPIVILVLLATGACVPFQLLMNECIAVVESKGQASVGRLQIGLLLFCQAIACAATIYCLSVQHFPGLHIAVVVILLAINTALSYRISKRYYRLVSKAVVSTRDAVVIGVIPGLTSLVLFVAYSLTARRDPQFGVAFIVLSTTLPSVAQWRYLQTFSDINASMPKNTDATGHPMATGWLLAVVLALAALAAGSTRLREMVSQLSTNHVALLLVALNSMLSLINTSTRAMFLNRAGGGQQRTLAIAVLAIGAVGVVAVSAGWLAAPLIALITTQLGIAWIIEVSRRIPTSLATG